MVVNECALLRAMREDYKGQGYTVARRFDNLDESDDESVLILSSGDWLVEIEWKNVPSKVFGLIAQHLKGLPAVGEAFTVKKKRNQHHHFRHGGQVPGNRKSRPGRHGAQDQTYV